MADKKSFLAQNIKTLRTMYGESQLELAFSIGINSPAAVSNYENGTRQPKEEIRRKIAAHYRITEEQLLYTDFSNAGKARFEIFDDCQKIKEYLFTLLPIVCSDEAMRSAPFARGYQAHVRIMQCIMLGKKPDDTDVCICLDSYEEAFKEDHVPEAIGNMVWWSMGLELCLADAGTLSDDACRLYEKLEAQKITALECIRKVYLKNFEFPDENGDEMKLPEKADGLTIDIMESNTLKQLEKLRGTRLAELSYYYMAVRYAAGIEQNEYSHEMNQAIGIAMLKSMAKIGNTYAGNLLRFA